MEEFLFGYLNYFTKRLNDICNEKIIENKEKFLKEAELKIKKDLEKLLAPSICWLLWIEKSKNDLPGKTEKEKFEFFANKYSSKLEKIYPDLEKIIKSYLNNELYFYEKIIKKLEENFNIIRKIFKIRNKKLKQIKIADYSDRHYKGFRTVFINFGEKIIKIKPFHFSFNENLFVIFKEIDSSLLKNFQNYIRIDNWWFSEFIEYKGKVNNKEASVFYYNIGKLLALAYCFNGVDFHMENIIAFKNTPIILDAESFLTNFSIFKNKRLNKNILVTGFLENKRNKQLTSAIFGGKKKLISFTDPVIYFRNTTRMFIRYKKFSNFKQHNRIFVNNKMANPTLFSKEIIKGFFDCYNKILEKKTEIINILERLENYYTRVILRKTSFYTILIRHTTQPLNFPLDKFKNKLSKTLVQNSRNFHKINKSNLDRVVKYEVNSILNQEIPIFWQDINRKTLYYPEGKIENFFERTAKEVVLEKIESLSFKDLDSKIKIIKRYLK
ncbi:hypothetical protein HRbin35_00010 [bacterium HR35]|nr:hypothetical protein HRbin35_00010 [bacterium HR35]